MHRGQAKEVEAVRLGATPQGQGHGSSRHYPGGQTDRQANPERAFCPYPVCYGTCYTCRHRKPTLNPGENRALIFPWELRGFYLLARSFNDSSFYPKLL